MQGDFTRLPFHPAKRDSRIYLQQGRVQLDADWNTQVDLFTHYLRNGIRDLIGDHGAPAADPGFDITVTTELLFDGKDDYILIGREEALYFKERDPFTIEVEFTPRSGEQQGGVLVACEGDQGGYLLRISEKGRPEFYRIHSETPVSDLGAPSLKSTRSCRFDTLNNLAVTYDGQNLYFYMNGVFVTRRSHTQLAPDFLPTFLIGARLKLGSPDDFFSGTIESISIWNQCRSQSQIRSVLNKEPDENEQGLVAWWPIDEQQGSSVTDRVRGIQGVLGSGNKKKQPTWVRRRLRIGVGRYYVNGIPCANVEPLYYSRQPDYPNAPMPPGVGEGSPALIYLDVWERLVTPMEDPSLAEPALGGVDTSVRTRIVQQVRLLPLNSKTGNPENAPEWKELLAQSKMRGQMTARYVPGVLPPKNLLYRVEVHCSGGVYGKPEERDTAMALAVEDILGENRIRVQSCPNVPSPGQLVEIYSQETDDNGQPGELGLVMETEDNIIRVEPFPTDLAMEDQPMIRAISGYKWSRNNASHVWPVQSLQPESQTILLESAGRSSFLLTEGAWVELIDTDRELHNRNEPLLQLGPVQDPTRLTTKVSLPMDLDLNETLRLRLWDQRNWGRHDEDQDLLAGLIPATSEWANLENGIQVRFEPRSKLKPGDYWMVPARAGLDNGLEWPTDENGTPQPKPPQGVEHHYAPLAHIKGSGNKVKITDLRRILTPITGGGAAPAPAPGPSQPPTPQPGHPDPSLDDPDSLFPDPDVDIPEGCAILSQKPQIPQGFQNTGLTIKADPWSTWLTPGVHQSRGPVAAMVSLVNLIFVFYENGDVMTFNPVYSEWSAATWMPTPRSHFACASLNGQIHVMGGVDNDGAYSDLCEIYDPATDTWSTGAPMLTARSHLMAANVGGVIIAAGGEARGRFGKEVLDVVEIFEPNNQWRTAQPMPEPRASAAATVIDGQMHLLGGLSKTHFGLFGGNPCNSHLVFEPEIDTWSNHPQIPQSSANLQAANPREGTVHLIDAYGRHSVYYPNRGYVEKESVPGLGEGFQMTAEANTLYLMDRQGEIGYRYQLDSLLHIFKKA